jgi:hypothetical protein
VIVLSVGLLTFCCENDEQRKRQAATGLTALP